MGSHNSIVSFVTVLVVCFCNTASLHSRVKLLLFVLLSVFLEREIAHFTMTSSESAVSIKEMADGLHPQFFNRSGLLFSRRILRVQGFVLKWPNLEVNLDIWHIMQRLAVAVTSEFHLLYGVFMARLSAAIFEWNMSDYSLLCRAKLGYLKTNLRIISCEYKCFT